MTKHLSENKGENNSAFCGVTYAEILSRAAANVEGEIMRTRKAAESASLSCPEEMIAALKDKLRSLQTMYLIETNGELQLGEFADNEE